MKKQILLITIVLAQCVLATVELKQSTQVIVRLGPFTDKTDGITAKTDIDLTVADFANALKAGGVAAVDVNAITFTDVPDCNGWYNATLTTGITDTLGELRIVIQDVSIFTPFWETFAVIDPNEWDRKYLTGEVKGLDVGEVVGTPGSVANWYSDITASTDVAELVWEDPNAVGADIALILADTGELQALIDANDRLPVEVHWVDGGANVQELTGDTYALANGATGFAAIDTVVDAILVDTAAQDTAGEWTTLGAGIGSTAIETGTVASASTAITFTLSADFPATANAYESGTIITITDADDSKQYIGRIKSYTVGRVVLLHKPLPITPANSDAVNIWPAIAIQADF